MTTLTEAAYFSKKTLFIFSIVLISLITLFVLYKTGNSILGSIISTNQIPAFVSFGKIPKLNMEEGYNPTAGITYSLETISGDLPKLAKMLKVFEVKEPQAGFGNLDDAKKIAEKVEFNVQPLTVSGGLAIFSEKGNKTRVLRVDLASRNFAIQSDYLNNQNIITTKPVGDDKEQKEVLEIFRNLGLSKVDFPDNKVKSLNYKIEGGKLIEAISISSANLVQVSFGRGDLDLIPIYYPSSKNPKVWALATGSEIIAAQWSMWNIQKHKFSTYPLKGVEKAYQELQEGKGVFNKEIDTNIFPIRDISLGYLETETYQKYLQPVYVFRSDEGLLAFVSAVDESWHQ